MKIVSLWLLCAATFAHAVGDCTFWMEKSCEQDAARAVLKLLMDANMGILTVNDTKYEYKIGICQAVPGEAGNDVGVVQEPKNGGKKAVIGRISNTSAVAWDRWMVLDYRQGDKYHHSCGKEQRMARIMFTCANVTMPKVRVIEENNVKGTDCYYMFEIQHQLMCNNIPNMMASSKLSAGSVFLIIFFTGLAAYLIIGAAYQRFVAGAKGIDQIPHLSFWQDFGNLQADGCDFVCRRIGRSRQSREYRGIGEEQVIPDYESDTNRDDSLLPM